MSTDVKNELNLNEKAQESLRKAVLDCIESEFGADGPKQKTPFAEIEEFGHEVGQFVARLLDNQAAQQHTKQHFTKHAPCPCCKTESPQKENLFERDFKTVDGDIPLKEPAYHCPVCNRDFFPSAFRFSD